MQVYAAFLMATSLLTVPVSSQGVDNSLIERIADDFDALWRPVSNATIHFEVESTWTNRQLTGGVEAKQSRHTREKKKLITSGPAFHMYSSLERLQLEDPLAGQVEISEELCTKNRHLCVTSKADGTKIEMVQAEEVPSNAGMHSTLVQGFLRDEYVPDLVRNRRWKVETPTGEKVVLKNNENGQELTLTAVLVNGRWRPESIAEKGKAAKVLHTIVGFEHTGGIPYVSELTRVYWGKYTTKKSIDVETSETTTLRVSVCDLSNPATPEELYFATSIPEGQPVTVFGSEWLHHAWQDGKVVQVTDPDAMKRLEEFEFKNQKAASRWKWMLFGATILIVFGIIILKSRSLRTLFILLPLLSQISAADVRRDPLSKNADGIDDFPPTTWDEPYCGIVSAWVLLNHFERAPDFRDLVKKEYVGSWEGSSGGQLQTLLKDYGVTSLSMVRTNIGTLSALTGPAILHTRSRTSPLYRHWVVFLGFDEDRIRVFDPNHGLQNLSSAEIQSQWDGLLIVGTQSHSGRISLVQSTMSEFLPYLAVCSFVLIIVARFRQCIPSHGKQTLSTAFALIVAASVAGMVCSHWLSNGIYQSDSALSTIAGLHPGQFLEAVDGCDVARAVEGADGGSESLLIDCRSNASFRKGTIPTAINLPVDATAAEESALLNNISPDVSMILFCQSEHCGYDEVVARRLIARGFNNIRLYHGGFRDWTDIVKMKHLPEKE